MLLCVNDLVILLVSLPNECWCLLQLARSLGFKSHSYKHARLQAT